MPPDEGATPATEPTPAPPATEKPKGFKARVRAFLQHEKVKAAWGRLRGGQLTPGRAAASVFVGVLVGTTPLYGLHFFLVMGICIPLKLDAALAYVASNVSLPIFAPFINMSEVELGAYMRTGSFIHLDKSEFTSRSPFDYAHELFLGTLIFSPAAASLFALVTYPIAWLARRRKLAKQAAEPLASGPETTETTPETRSAPTS